MSVRQQSEYSFITSSSASISSNGSPSSSFMSIHKNDVLLSIALPRECKNFGDTSVKCEVNFAPP